MLWNNDLLNSVNVLFFWSVVGLNVFGLLVTQVLGSVFRAVMLTARTASVRLTINFLKPEAFRACGLLGIAAIFSTGMLLRR